MSTPFPTEEASQTERFEPTFDLDTAKPQTHWYSGFGFNEETAYLGPAYRALETAGNAAAKGEAVMGGIFGLAGRIYNSVGKPRVVGQELEPIGASITQDALERVRATTPDPQTTGTAAQVLNAVGSGAIRYTVGTALGGPIGAASLIGSTESATRYGQLREQGVDQTTAGESAALAGITSAAGAFLPAAYGSSLLARLATGAGSNVGFGLVNRFADHQILERGGYPEMAEQQKIMDGTQMLVDAALGATFGYIHHLGARDADKQDAALTANLALRDRQSAPGVATDPGAANAHQAALEKAQTDLMSGKPVDVSDSAVKDSTYLSRPTRDLTPESNLILNAFKESGLLDEEANLRDLEAQFERRRSGEAPRGTPEAESPSITHTIDEDNIHTVRSANGETTAKQRGDYLQSIETRTDEAAQGKGEGYARTERLIQEAQDRGLTFASDNKVSPAAVKLYDKLERNGYEVIRNPAEPDEEGHLVSTAGRPVFEVKPKESTQPTDPIQQALEERPNLEIPGENGEPQKASEALEGAKDQTDWKAAVTAAANCFGRKGG